MLGLNLNFFSIVRTLIFVAISYYVSSWIMSATNNLGLTYELGQGIVALSVLSTAYMNLK